MIVLKSNKLGHRLDWLNSKVTFVVLGVIMLLILVGALIAAARSKPSDPFTATTRSSVPMPLYYPSSLGRGFKIDANSVTQPDSGVVVYQIVGPDGARIYVSEEKWDNSIKLEGFYGNLKSTDEVSTPLGPAKMGESIKGQNRVASLVVGGRTWIIMNSKTSVQSAEMETALKSLKLSQ